MAAPVWTLSVDLQTKTAAFTTGMADAAKAARGSFSEIKEGAKEAGTEVGYSMFEARHSVMILGEEFGVHLPRALTSFIAGLGPLGAALEAAFPFLAIILGATLLLEHLNKIKEAGEKLTESQERFKTTIQNTFNALDEKLLEAGIQSDELSNNHFAALKKRLELIDKQSLKELVHSFEEVAKSADVVMKELEGHWYTFGIGSAGAQHALTQFQAKYESLIAQGKDKEATDLLKGTRESAEHTLAMMHQLTSSQLKIEPGKVTQQGDYGKHEEAANALKAAGVGITEKEVQAQEALVAALQAQVIVEGKVADLKKAQDGNSVKTENKRAGGDVAADMAREGEAYKQAQEQAQKAWEEAHKVALDALEQGEREKIAATEQGSQERLQAINAALKQEEAYGLQETGFYRSLMTQKVEVTRQMVDEQEKLEAEAGNIAAAHAEKMGMLQLAADKQADALRNSGHRFMLQERLDQEAKYENIEYELKMAANARDIAALDKHGKDYENKLKTLQNKEEELTKEHENRITAIKEKAEEERNSNILSAENRFNSAIASGLTQAIMGHESFAKMMDSLGNQVVSGMMQNAIKSMLADDMTKEKDAAAAARKAYLSGTQMGGIAGAIIAPVWAAAAFAAVMAFESGGIVPGVGMGDSVPAMLTPGESVLPKNLTEGLMMAASNGNLGGSGGDVHLHYRPTYHVQAIDGASVRGMLQTHSQEFAKHFHNEVRKLNR